MDKIVQEQKMKQWAETFKGGKFKRFIDSPETLQLFYIKHNMPLTVADCVVDGKAKLTLMIASIMPRKPILMCKDCFKKVCDEENCGSEDYIERQPRAYMAADKTGAIKIGVAPFHDDIAPLVEDEIYIVEGTIREFKGNREISVSAITTTDGKVPIENAIPTVSTEVEAVPEAEARPTDKKPITEKDSLDKAIEVLNDALELYAGKIPTNNFNKMTEHLSIADLKNAMTKLSVKETDGVYQVQ